MLITCDLCKEKITDDFLSKITHTVVKHPQVAISAMQKHGVTEKAFDIGKAFGEALKGKLNG